MLVVIVSVMRFRTMSMIVTLTMRVIMVMRAWMIVLVLMMVIRQTAKVTETVLGRKDPPHTGKQRQRN